VAGGASGDYAVHHVDAHAGVFYDFVGEAYAHYVSGLVFGEQRQDFGYHFAGEFAGFAYGQAAYGVAVKIQFDEALGGFTAEVGIHAALDYSEEALGLTVQLIVPGDFVLVGAEMLKAASGPGHGVAKAFGGSGFGGGVFGAFVEGHADVRAEGDLDVHGVFWGEHVAAAVEMGAELDAFVGDFAEFGEGEDLESAAVGEQAARPGDELVQAAEAGYEFMAGAEVEVLGVAENDLRALARLSWFGWTQLFQDVLRDGFNCALGAYGHEDWCFYGLVGEMDAGAAGAGGVGA